LIVPSIGAALKAAHTIYVWDHETGTLDKILEGPREPLQDVHVSISKHQGDFSSLTSGHQKCHPARSSICSVNTAGLIYVWATVTTEKWGAFAANFEELDENVEYEEREDEFDIVSQCRIDLTVLPTERFRLTGR
jgi:COMPASS component SWD1